MAFSTKASLLYVVAFILLTASIQASWFNDDTELEPLLSETDSDQDYQLDQPAYQAPALTTCATTCKGTNRLFNYEPDQTYEYSYEGNVKTTVPQAISEHSSLHLKATVSVDVLSTCDMRLRLTDVTVMDSNPTSYDQRTAIPNLKNIKKTLQSTNLRFSFDDGTIESVCPGDNDEPWAVNILKAIASNLQNTMTSQQGVSYNDETDINGICPSRYEVTSSSSWSSSLKVKKSKDLVSCRGRAATNSLLQGVPYLSKSKIQSLPILKSSQICDQEIDLTKKILTKSSCVESHQFQPITSRKDSGATTDVDFAFTFVRVSATPRSITDAVTSSRTTLQFDHSSAATSPETVSAVKTTLTQVCDQSAAAETQAETFSALLKQLKTLDEKSMGMLAREVKQMCDKAQTLWSDSLPLVQTASSIRVVKNMMKTRQMPANSVDIFFNSFAFIRTPTPDIMAEIKTFLTTDFEKSSLGVSSLINTFCRLNDCSSNNDVKMMMKNFEDELKYNCKAETPDQEMRMLRSLKSIGNAGYSDRISNTLILCASNGEAPMRLRVAAVEAFRRLDCANRDGLLALLENKKLDSELRIQAYLQTISCADRTSVERVKRLLENEEVNQVGSFIWTHLSNLRESDSPMKSRLSDILDDATLRQSFDLDARKFSRNLEFSTFNEIANFGASVDSNIVWSQKSFVPRSANLNLTVDLFGKQVNLMEVGARAEGLEETLERYARMWKEDDDESNDVGKRRKRAVVRDDAINAIDRKFQKKADEASIIYSVKIFGNELDFYDLIRPAGQPRRDEFNPLQMLIQMAKDQKVEYTRSYQLVDASLNLPTGLGLPLKLTLEVNGVVNIQGQGKVDIRQVFSNPSNFDVSGNLNPSASLVATAEMGIDSIIAKAGLKLSNKLVTKGQIDGKLQLKDGKIFNFDISTPQDRIEIFSAESHFYVTYRAEEREQTSADPKSTYTYRDCTGSDTLDVIGLDFCAEVSYPTVNEDEPALPFTQPAYARLYASKPDSNMKSIHFDWSLTSERAVDKFRVSYSTPGSQADRECTVEVTVDKAQMQLQANLRSPWKKVKVDGSLTNTDATRRIYLGAMLDDKDTYSFTAELKKQDKPPLTVQYTPKIVLAIAGRPDVTLDGLVSYIKGRKVEIKMAIKNLQTTPITFDGNMQMAERISKYNATMKFISKSLRVGFSGSFANLQDIGNSWATRADLTYQYLNNPKEQILINHKIRDMSTKNLKSYSMDCSFVTSAMSGDLGTELAYSSNSLRTKLTVGQDDYKRFTITQAASFDLQSAERKVNGRVKVEVPFKNVNYELMLNHADSQDHVQTNATLRLSDDKVASFDLGLKKDPTRFLKASGELKIRSPTGHQITASTIVLEKVPREYTNDLAVQIISPRWSGDMSATTLYKMAAKHEWTSTIYLPQYSPITVSGHLSPNPKNFMLRNEIIYNGRTYMVDGKMTHRGNNWLVFNTLTSLDVTYPGREHGARVEISRKNAELGLDVDVKLARDMKVAVTSSITANQYQPRVQVKVEWPGDNFVALLGQGKYETKGWLSTTNDVEGSLKFTSSFRNFEELLVSAKYDHAPQHTKVSTEIGWAPSQVIATEFTAEKTKLTVNATTPFDGYETIKALSTYSLRNKLVTSNTKVQWGDNQVAIFLNVDANSLPSLSGKVALTSSFRGYESIVANLKHQMTNGKINTNADVTWSRNQQIAVALATTYAVTDRSSNINGELTLRTPFRNMQVNKWTWTHQQDSDVLKFRHEVEFYSQKYAFDVNMQKILNRQMKKIFGKIELNTPHDFVRIVSTEFSSQFELNAVRGHIRLTGTLNDKSIGLENSLDIVPNQSMTLKALATTPFEGYETLGLDMDNRMTSKNAFSASNELSLAYLGKISISGSGNFEPELQELVLRVTTPCQDHERLAFNFRNIKKEDQSWESKAVFEANSASYTAESRLNFAGRQKRFDLDIDTPLHQLRKMKFVSTFSGQWTNFQLNAELQHNLLDQKVKMTLAADTRDKKSITVNFNFASPIEQLAVVKVNGKYMADSNNRATTIGSFEVNKYTGNLRSVMTGKSWSDVTVKNEVTYSGNKKINLDLDFKVANDITANLLFKSPLETLPFLSNKFSLKDDMVSNELKFGNQQRPKTVLAKSEWTTSGDDFSFNARLTTPYSQVERLVFQMAKTGPWDSLKGEISAEWNDKKIASTAEFRLSASDLSTSAILETPFQELRRLGYSLTHNGPATNFANSLTFKYNDQEISAASSFRADGPAGQITIKTPYERVQIFTASMTHTPKSRSAWTNAVVVSLNGNKILTTDIDFSESVMKAKGTLKADKDYTVNLVSNMDSRGATHNLVLKIGRDRVTAKITGVNPNPYNIELKTLVDTTFRGYEKFEWIFTFKGEREKYDFKATNLLTTPIRGYDRFYTDLTFQGYSDDFSTTLKLEHPYERYSPVEATLKHKMTRDQITDGFNLNYGSEMIKASLVGDLRMKPMSRIDIKLTTSYPDYERFSAAFEMMGQSRDTVYYSAEINTSIPDYETFNATLSHASTGPEFVSSRLSLNSVSRIVPSVDVTYSQEYNPRDLSLNAKLNIILPAGPIEVSYVQEPTSTEYHKAIFSLTTPYSGYEKVELSSEYVDKRELSQKRAFGLTDLSYTAQLLTPFRNWESTRFALEQKGERSWYETHYELATSYPNYEKMTYDEKMKFGGDALHYEYSFTSTIPGYEKERILLDHKGNQWDNFKTVFEVETPYKYMERLATTVQTGPNKKSTRGTFTLEHSQLRNGGKISAVVDYTPTKKSSKVVASLETPFRGYEKFGATFDNQWPSTDSIKSVLVVNTPIRGYQQFSAYMTHSGADSTNFRTSFKINTPIQSMPTILMVLRHQGKYLNKFESGLSIEYADKKIEGEIKFVREPLEHNLNAWLTLPCPVVRNIKVVSTRSYSNGDYSGNGDYTGNFEVTYNDAKKVDFDYTLKTNGEKSVVFAMRSPFSSETSVNLGDRNAVAVINWDKTDPNSQVQFELGFKNIATSAKTDRGAEFRFILPDRRVVGFNFEYQLESGKFNHQASVTWDRNPGAEIEYIVEGKTSQSRSQTQTEGRLSLKSPVLTFTASANHKKADARCTTYLAAETDSGKSTFTFDTQTTDNGFKNDITVTCPSLTREVKLSTEGILSRTVAMLKSTLKWEGDQTLMGEVKVTEDEETDGKATLFAKFAHPYSGTDVELRADMIEESYDRTLASAILDWKMTRTGETQTAAFNGAINERTMEISAEVKLPWKTISLNTVNREYDDDRMVYRYDVIYRNGDDATQLTTDFSVPDRMVSAKLTCGQNGIQLYGQVESPVKMSADLNRFEAGQMINEANIGINIDDEKMLTGRLYYNPNLAQALASSWSKPMSRRDFEMKMMAYKVFGQSLSQDLEDKRQKIEESFRPIAESIRQKMAQLADNIVRVYRQMYRNNDFYIRDIVRYLDEVNTRISNAMEGVSSALRESVESTRRSLAAGLREWADRSARINEMVQEYSERIGRKLGEISPDMHFIADLKIKMHRHAMRIREAIENDETLGKVAQNLKTFSDPVKFKRMVFSWLDEMARKMQAAVNDPNFREAMAALVARIKENSWMYSFLGFDEEIHGFLDELTQIKIEEVVAKVTEYVEETFKISQCGWKVWDPRKAEYVFQVYVPVTIPDIDYAYLMEMQEYLEDAVDMVMGMIPEEDWNLVDTLYAYKPPTDIEDLFPPFKGHATLVGSQHYTTFDKKSFEFSGECSYLLTRDFVGKTFAVVANYEKSTTAGRASSKKSINVLIDDKQVEIFNDARVTLDGVRTELPINFGNTSVVRHENQIVLKNEARGLGVKCHLPQDICIVAVSGWNFGKLAGLLGSYNNEPSDDIQTIEGNDADKTELFADSWTVGQKCRPANKAVQVPEEPDTRRYKICAGLFKDTTSPFRSCFKTVNPDAYLQMCLNDMSTNENKMETIEDACTISAAYVHDCKSHEVHLRVPRECVKCESPMQDSKYFYENELLRVTSDSNMAAKMADVVFIVEHAPCNKEVVDKLKTVMDDLTRAMGQEGIASPKFAVVGYGGKDALGEAHTMTLEGQIFNTGSKLFQMPFSTVSGPFNDTFSAIRYAARLPFRAGASKNFVLLSCGACTEKSMRYTDVQRVLLQQDIRFHHLIQDSIRMKASTAKNAFIFGFDEQTVYTRKDVASEDLSGEADLRKYIKLPKDFCSALTQDTDGSVFSLRQWLDSRVAIQKRFSDVLVRIIARKSRPSDCQTCHCSADESSIGASHCTPCEQRRPTYSYAPDFQEEIEEEVATAAPSVTRRNDSRPDFVTAMPNPLTPRPAKRPVTRKPKPQKPAKPVVRPVRPAPKPATKKPAKLGFFF